MSLDLSHPATVPAGEAVEITAGCTLTLGDRLIGPGTLTVTLCRVYFRGATQSLSFPYPYMLLHAISRDTVGASIYIQFNLSEEDMDHYDDDEDEDGNPAGNTEASSPRPPADCRFLLDTPDVVQDVFAALSRGAAANPDHDSDESDGPFNVSEDVVKRFEDMITVEEGMEELGYDQEGRWEDPDESN